MKFRHLLLPIATFLSACLAGTAALAHEGWHLPGMTHPHVEIGHMLFAGAAALAVLLALARRGGRPQ